MHSWDDESGDWQDLASTTQAPRYRTLAQLIAEFCPSDGSVLDIGCGSALLRSYLPDSLKYLGVEPSAKAVESARAKYGYDRVVYSTAEGFNPGKRAWDAIVFNEMLYYARDPIGLLVKFAAPGEIIIVSIYQKPERFSFKTHLHHLLDRRRPRSNVHCTKMVYDFMKREGWSIQKDESLPIPGGSNYWRIFVAKTLK